MLKKIFLLVALALFTFAGQNEKIKASDMPFGYASIGATVNFGGYNGKDTKRSRRPKIKNHSLNTPKWAITLSI